VFAVELLAPDPVGQPAEALAIFHLNTDQANIADLVRRVAGRRASPAPAPDLAAPLHPYATLAPRARPFTIAFLTSTERRLPRPPDASHVRSWSRAEQWLWLLASRSSQTDYPPDPDHADQLLSGTVVLSADWRGLITRDGAAFVGLRRDHGNDDPFLGYAQLYTHTAYLDALILGMIQRSNIEMMTDDAARAFDAQDLPRHLGKLEERAARFRSVYWLRDTSAHGPPNDILTAYQAQHRLPERFDTVLSEIGDLSRIVQTQEGQQVGAALSVITVLGLPIGTVLGILQVLGANSPSDLLIGMLAALAATGGLLLTRLGRLLIRALRRM
jgi:hypothetical protein